MFGAVPFGSTAFSSLINLAPPSSPQDGVSINKLKSNPGGMQKLGL